MKPTQHPQELAAFADLVRAEGCRSYLEIGSKRGTSLQAVAAALVKPRRVVSVDLGQGHEDFEALVAAVGRLDGTLIVGDSVDPQTIALARERAPFDLVFIDANHTLPFVWRDWENYGPMARIVAFHDITGTSSKIHVSAFWASIKGAYRHCEIRVDPVKHGIGVLWR